MKQRRVHTSCVNISILKTESRTMKINLQQAKSGVLWGGEGGGGGRSYCLGLSKTTLKTDRKHGILDMF